MELLCATSEHPPRRRRKKRKNRKEKKKRSAAVPRGVDLVPPPQNHFLNCADAVFTVRLTRPKFLSSTPGGGKTGTQWNHPVVVPPPARELLCLGDRGKERGAANGSGSQTAPCCRTPLLCVMYRCVRSSHPLSFVRWVVGDRLSSPHAPVPGGKLEIRSRQQYGDGDGEW